MTGLEGLLDTWGAPVIVLGTFLEGETILVLAGLAAQRGYLSLPAVIVAAFVGSFLGDQLYFHLGRRHGEAFLARRPGWRAGVERAQRFLERHHVIFILGFRFLYGLRTVSPFAVGMSRVPVGRYVVLNLLGAILWAVVVALLGYSLGGAATLLLDRVKEVEAWLFLGVAVAGLAVWSFYFLRRRRRSAAAELQPPLSPPTG